MQNHSNYKSRIDFSFNASTMANTYFISAYTHSGFYSLLAWFSLCDIKLVTLPPGTHSINRTSVRQCVGSAYWIVGRDIWIYMHQERPACKLQFTEIELGHSSNLDKFLLCSIRLSVRYEVVYLVTIWVKYRYEYLAKRN